ncbi:hypothetical protein [Aerococcus tenax]|uniref:hypothetical protein n=1 Tax=Aerococcus tenax TaxID=3078812 RepID=UPI0018A730EE|nr:hypothetical protein [Aerococcus tenax]
MYRQEQKDKKREQLVHLAYELINSTTSILNKIDSYINLADTIKNDRVKGIEYRSNESMMNENALSSIKIELLIYCFNLRMLASYFNVSDKIKNEIKLLEGNIARLTEMEEYIEFHDGIHSFIGGKAYALNEDIKKKY